MTRENRDGATRWWMRVGLLGAAVCAVLLGVAPVGHASFPGSPGEIVFSSTFTGDQDIYVAAADGSGRVDLTNDPHADITPSWSADGRRIAFASDRSGWMEIYVMNADGSGVVQVTLDGAYADDPRFTADGRFIVYESKRGGNWEVRRIGVDGNGEVDLTHNRASDRSPATSPNGRMVAFSSNRGTTGTHIWTMTIQGKGLRRVTTTKGSQTDPSWAPAGGRLAYVAGAPGVGTNIWTVLANGHDAHRLTQQRNSAEINPSWSPDAHSIVYQDCSTVYLIGCTLSVQALGGSPVDISQLRAPFLDTFDAGDSKLWQSFQNGTGATNNEANGKLITTLDAASVEGGQYDEIEAHWGTTCRLAGDFDVQVDYQLVEWPSANGVQAMFSSFDTSNQGFNVSRESQTYGEQYTSWIPSESTSQPTSDLTGTLRLRREGSTAVVSYLNGATWVPVASGPTTTSSATITIGASSFMGRFAHQEVKIAWDNFRINSGTLSCPDLSWDDDTPDWQAVG